MTVVAHFPSGVGSEFFFPNTKVIWTIVFTLSGPQEIDNKYDYMLLGEAACSS